MKVEISYIEGEENRACKNHVYRVIYLMNGPANKIY